VRAPAVEPLTVLYPNPAAGRVTLHLELDREMVVRSEIRQLATGRLVWARNLGRLGPASFTVDLVPDDVLPSGAYIVRLFLGDEVVTGN